MRKLLLFSAGFAAACALGAYLLLGVGTALVGAALIVLSAAGMFITSKDHWKKLLVVTLGFAVGLVWFQVYDFMNLSSARKMDSETVSTTIRTTDFSFDTGYGTGVDGKIRLGNRVYRARVYLDGDQSVSPGCVIHGQFRLRFTPPGGQREATYHRGQGIFLMAYQVEGITVEPASGKNLRYVPAYLRQRITNLLGTIFSESAAPFAKALLIGDTTDLDYGTQTHLGLSGIRHVAAVSGLHVSILFSMIYLVSGRKRYLTAVIGIPCLLLFAAVAGFTPSIMRSCIMQGLMILAIAFNREYDPPTALAFAVLTMLGANPHSVTSVGFQLSVGSVAGILLFANRINARILGIKRLTKISPKSVKGRLIRVIAGSVSVSLSAIVFTAPLTAVYFGSVSLIGILTNLLCLWAVTVLFCGIIAACLIGCIYVPAAKVFCWILEILIDYILGVSSILSRFPLAAVFMDSGYIVAWLVLCYIFFAVFLLLRGKHPLVFLCCTVISLCVALLLSWGEPLLYDYQVTMLDVGQGQCVILQDGRRTYVVDCGGDREEEAADKAADYLHSQGIYRIDGLIVTHYDRDHVAGIPYLLQRIKADVLVLPQNEHELKSMLVDAHKGRLLTADHDVFFDWNGGSLSLFSSIHAKSDNESSLCVLFQTKKCDILITGDRTKTGEVELLQTHTLPDIEILIAGHHGAKDATGELLLNATKPETVLISVSKNNHYGHPAEETIQRLNIFACRIRRTDQEGTIIIRG